MCGVLSLDAVGGKGVTIEVSLNSIVGLIALKTMKMKGFIEEQ